MIDLTFFTIDDFYDIGLFELRDIAAFLGVESPTTYSKRKLVDLAYKAKCGLPIPGKKEGRGRPTKPAKNNYSIDWDNVPERQSTYNEDDDFIMPITSKTNANDDIVRYTPDNCGDKIEENAVPFDISGILDIMQDGYGFIRVNNCENSVKDAYVNSKLIKFYGLRKGDYIKAIGKRQYENKPPAITEIKTVNNFKIDDLDLNRPHFDSLTPIYPNEKIILESRIGRTDLALRFMDLVSPIGKGQRAMIVAPPKAGKTTLMKKLANSVKDNNPNLMLYVLLIDERPEEVTDMRRSIDGIVIYSTFDETPEHHVKAAELVIESAKRNVEMGRDVVIIMDSLTRLARAYNLTISPTGRSLSGGIDPGALHAPKKFFGSARNIENGGSLTIIATALVETGSRMDDVIFEEFKGTGNMEIVLDRKLSEKRIFPAIDIDKSGTRRDDLLLTQSEFEGVMNMRKLMSADGSEATEKLLDVMLKTKNNKEFLEQIDLQIKQMDKQGYKFR